MSFYRPPEASPWIVWAGRAVALGGVALGVASYAMGVELPGISEGIRAVGNAAGIGSAAATASEIFTPLVLGTFGSLAVWRSAEKADQVRRYNVGYRRGLNEALDNGLSDIPLPSGLLDKSRQASWLTTSAAMSMGALLAIAGGFAMFGGTLGALSSVGPGIGTLMGGIGLTGMGYTAWKVGSIAAEAREFAHSTEASAERGRITETETAESIKLAKEILGPDLAPALPATTHPTPFTDRYRAEQTANALATESATHTAPSSKGFLARLIGERSAEASQALQRH
jgi:hypothetical protein